MLKEKKQLNKNSSGISNLSSKKLKIRRFNWQQMFLFQRVIKKNRRKHLFHRFSKLHAKKQWEFIWALL